MEQNPMTPLKLAEIEAEKRYPATYYSGAAFLDDKCVEGKRAAFIAGDQRDRWISVEDDLPENKRDVLISQSGNVGYGWYDVETKEWCDTFVSGLMFVTHWQELPSPPSNP